MSVTKLAVLLLAVLLPLAARFLLLSADTSRQKRYRQLNVPYLAILYAIVCTAVFSNLFDLFRQLLNLPFMQRIQAWALAGSRFSLSVEVYSQLLFNLALIVVFWVIKTAYRGLMYTNNLLFRRHETDEGPNSFSQITGLRRLYWKYINFFYDIENGSRKLRPRFQRIRYALCAVSRITGLLYLLFIALMHIPILNDYNWFPYQLAQDLFEAIYIWPVISLIVLWECTSFLGGDPGSTLSMDEAGSKGKQRKPVDYIPLIRAYAKQFPHFFQLGMVHNASRGLSQDSTLSDRVLLVKQRFAQLEPDRQLTDDQWRCIADIESKKNIIAMTALGSPLSHALLVLLNVLLARGENVLVLCNSTDTVRSAQSFFEQTLHEANVFAPVWNVRGNLHVNQADDTDVLIITADQLLNSSLMDAQQQFIEGLSFVLMLETPVIASIMGAVLAFGMQRLEHASGHSLQYVCLSDMLPLNLGPMLEKLLCTSRFIYHNALPKAKDVCLCLWNQEPARENLLLQQELFGKRPDMYLGAVLPLAAYGFKNAVKDISILGTLPFKTIESAVNISNDTIADKLNGVSLSQMLKSHVHINDVIGADPFIIQLDQFNNLPAVLRNTVSFVGIGSSMIHVVSKPYMLRDFFAAHVEDFITDPAAAKVYSVFPEEETRTEALKLMTKAEDPRTGLEERELRDFLRKYCSEIDDCDTVGLENALELLTQKALDKVVSDSSVCSMFSIATYLRFIPKEAQFVRQKAIKLLKRDLLDQLLTALQPARAVYAEHSWSLTMEKGNIFRFYLPNQHIVLGSELYFIDSIDPTSGEIKLANKSEDLRVPVDYLQDRHYSVDLPTVGHLYALNTGATLVRTEGTMHYSLTRYRNVPINVETEGYYALNPTSPILDLKSNNGYRILGEADSRLAYRTTDSGSVMLLTINSIQSDMADRLAFTLAVLLTELSKTLFPYSWPCLAICPVLHDRASLSQCNGSGVSFEALSHIYPQVTVKEILKKDKTRDPETPDLVEAEQKNILLTDENAVRLLIIEDSEHTTGMLDALWGNRQYPLEGIFEALKAYLDWHLVNADQDVYLNYGAAEPPACMDLEATARLLTNLLSAQIGLSTWLNTQNRRRCYFCKRPLLPNQWDFVSNNDGKPDRAVCNSCMQRLLSKPAELKKLLNEVRAYFKDKWGQKLRGGIIVRFKSAEEITRQFGVNSDFRIIGLASPRREIWVETSSTREHILAILAHELTHIWQYDSLDLNDRVMQEGQAKTVEIQLLTDKQFLRLAQYEHDSLMVRQDEYGQGYRILRTALEEAGSDDTFAYMLQKYPKIGHMK